MANLEEIQTAITQGALLVRAMRETDLPTEQHIKRSIPDKHCRSRYTRPVIHQPTFNWKVPDRYVKLLSFALAVVNMLGVKCITLVKRGRSPS